MSTKSDKVSDAAASFEAQEIADRCLIHADKMDDLGWYVTANVLRLAADKLRNHADAP